MKNKSIEQAFKICKYGILRKFYFVKIPCFIRNVNLLICFIMILIMYFLFVIDYNGNR